MRQLKILYFWVIFSISETPNLSLLLLLSCTLLSKILSICVAGLALKAPPSSSSSSSSAAAAAAATTTTTTATAPVAQEPLSSVYFFVLSSS